MYLATLLSSCLLPLAVSALPSIGKREANGLISVPFTKRLTTPEGLDSRTVTAPLRNGIFQYTIDMTIGTPPQPFSLVLDTGSSDIWVYSPQSKSSCSTCTTSYYDPSKSSSTQKVDSLGVFNITYGTPNSGVVGYYATDLVGVGGSSVRQTIAVATTAHSGDPKGGIFGVGLSKGESIYGQKQVDYSGYIDTLYANKLIPSRSYSVYLNSKTARDTAKGSILFGGTDSSKYSGNLVAFPLVVPAPDGVFRLDIAEPTMTFDTGSGSGAVQVPSVNSNYVVLMDTGTAISRIPASQFAVIAQAVNAQIINNGPIYAVGCDLAKRSGGVSFAFAGPKGTQTIQVPWSEMVITDSSLPSGYCDFGLAPLAERAAEGTYILGDTTLRNMYLYFNFDNATISLAQAKFT